MKGTELSPILPLVLARTLLSASHDGVVGAIGAMQGIDPTVDSLVEIRDHLSAAVTHVHAAIKIHDEGVP